MRDGLFEAGRVAAANAGGGSLEGGDDGGVEFLGRWAPALSRNAVPAEVDGDDFGRVGVEEGDQFGEEEVEFHPRNAGMLEVELIRYGVGGGEETIEDVCRAEFKVAGADAEKAEDRVLLRDGKGLHEVW